MDWFERITGFPEESYAETKRRLSAIDGRLYVDGQDTGFDIGKFEVLSLSALRERASPFISAGLSLQASVVQGDVRRLHSEPTNDGALFQVASQFNLLEMVGPDVTSEHGISRYAHDRTQGPACAIAAGAGTIFRNYLVPVSSGSGQTRDDQVDVLADLGRALGNLNGSLWQMRNGYALSTSESLAKVNRILCSSSPSELDALRELIQVGIHWGVRVTDSGVQHRVSQVYCSALPVAYCRAPRPLWAHFAMLVLEAMYEATLLVGVLNRALTSSPTVFLTRLGGGAFGNEVSWIHASILRALEGAKSSGLHVRLVSHGPPTGDMLDLLDPYSEKR